MKPQAESRSFLLGILVGGRSTRMGGRAKGTLELPSGESILESLAREFLIAAPGSPIVLLGRHQAYAGFGYRQLADLAGVQGPAGGVHSLLKEANALGHQAILVGCDMPFVNAALFERLLKDPTAASSVAPKSGTYWEPLFSRHNPAAALSALEQCLTERRYSLQQWLAQAGCTELKLSASERRQLRDWDTPADVAESFRDRGAKGPA